MTTEFKRMQQMRGSTGDWAAHNIAPLDGEMAIERDGSQIKLKLGDGSTPYSDLPYIYPSPPFVPKGSINAVTSGPPGALPGDVWINLGTGNVNAGWGAPAAGRATLPGDQLIMMADHTWSLIPVHSEANIFVQAGAGAVTRSPQDKMRERVTPADFGAVGDGIADDTAAVNAALATGHVVDTQWKQYRIKSRLIPIPGTHLTGHGEFIADPAFSDAVYADGLNMMIKLCTALLVDRGIVFNGNSIMTAGFWLYGARNTGPVDNVTLDCTFKDLSFTGVDISHNGGAWSNTRVAVRGYVTNCGWSGVEIAGVTLLNHDNLEVYRTGWHGINLTNCFQVTGNGFLVNKSVPPYRIYNGAGGGGGTEKGFLFSHFNVNTARWTNFLLYDNRNAADDGFGIGEDGSGAEAESANIYAQGQIWYAGLFGFDASSNMVADLQIWYPKNQGVQLGFDLGGTLSNVDITAQVYSNTADEAVRFSATGTAQRTVSITNGSANATIVGGTDGGSNFFVVPGQKITGTGIPAGTTVISKTNNAIVMSASATATNASAALSFRGVITFVNCKVDVRAVNCVYGVGIESGADGYASYTNCEVLGDLSGVTTDSVRPLNGNYGSGMAVKARRYFANILAKTAPTFSAIGNDTFGIASGGTLNAITNGFHNQEITCFVNTLDLILHPDWTDAGANGANRLIGNGNVNITVKAGGMFKARFRNATGWYFYGVTQPT